MTAKWLLQPSWWTVGSHPPLCLSDTVTGVTKWEQTGGTHSTWHPTQGEGEGNKGLSSSRQAKEGSATRNLINGIVMKFLKVKIKAKGFGMSKTTSLLNKNRTWACDWSPASSFQREVSVCPQISPPCRVMTPIPCSKAVLGEVRLRATLRASGETPFCELCSSFPYWQTQKSHKTGNGFVIWIKPAWVHLVTLFILNVHIKCCPRRTIKPTRITGC